MRNMFSCCSSLDYLDLSNFETPNVENIRDMFANCTSLHDLNLNNFIINYDIAMNNIFENCSSLNVIDISDNKLIEIIKKYFVVEPFMDHKNKYIIIQKRKMNIGCCEIL